MKEIKGYKITEVLKAVLNSSDLEAPEMVLTIWFNIEKDGEKKALGMGHVNDGDSISVRLLDRWVCLEDYKNMNLYKTLLINKNQNKDSDIFPVIGKTITKLEYGLWFYNFHDESEGYLFSLLRLTAEDCNFVYENCGDDPDYDVNDYRKILSKYTLTPLWKEELPENLVVSEGISKFVEDVD